MYNPAKQEEYLAFAVSIAKKADEIMKYYNGKKDASEYKKDDTIVTMADKAINDYLVEMVAKTYPDHSVDGEERQSGKSDCVWVCDPIDGTAMYANSVPVSTSSLALVVDGVPMVGVILDPWRGYIYTAMKGKGAFRNGEAIHVSEIPLEDKRSMGCFEMHPSCEYDVLGLVKELPGTYFVSLGSVVRAGIAVAEGAFTCAVFPACNHKNCDSAAFKLIVEEAGGVVLSIRGKEQRYDQSIDGCLMTNKVSYQAFYEAVQKVLVKRK